MKKIIKNIIIFFIPIELFEHARFEMKSKLGRLLSRGLKLNRKNNNYLNLGCGDVYEENFINIDFFTNKQIDYGMDLRFPFKIESNSVDGIFTNIGLINNKFFTAENRQKDILYRSLLGVSVNIMLNIILIKKYGINGAALATIAAQISTSLIYTYLKKDSRILFFMFLKCFDARRIFQRII